MQMAYEHWGSAGPRGSMAGFTFSPGISTFQVDVMVKRSS